MAKSKIQKQELLETYMNKISSSESIIFVKQVGLKVNTLNEFRKTLFDLNSHVSTLKNSIFNLALSKSGYDAKLDGGSYLALFAYQDSINTAKELKKFLNEFKDDTKTKLDIIFSVYEGSILNKEQTEQLADTPDKKASISMILGILDQAMSSVINLLEDPVRSYVIIIDKAFKN